MKLFEKAGSTMLIYLIRVYQVTFAVWLGGNCRFVPSCSEYSKEAIETAGVFGGTWLAAKRLCRCHPLGGHGFDPVKRQQS